MAYNLVAPVLAGSFYYFDKQDYYKIKHMTDKCKNIEFPAVVNGTNPGRVYVDDPTETKAALIWIQGQNGFQIVGDPQSKSFLAGLEMFMRDHIEPKLKNQSIDYVELGGEIGIWNEAIQLIFRNRKISNDIQHVFTLKEYSSHASEYKDNDEVIIRRIDNSLFGINRLDNHSYLEEKILRFWDSIDSFLQQGFGYFVDHNNKAVSLCLSAFVIDRTHAIDIETLEGFRRRNYGTAVARAYIQDCIQKQITPYWDCTPGNTGSIRIAKTIGLTPNFDYKIFWYAI